MVWQQVDTMIVPIIVYWEYLSNKFPYNTGLLVHIFNKVAIARVVDSIWMFFIERFMEELQGFFLSKGKTKG